MESFFDRHLRELDLDFSQQGVDGLRDAYQRLTIGGLISEGTAMDIISLIATSVRSNDKQMDAIRKWSKAMGPPLLLCEH